jgi:cellulose synthase operon protein C
VLDLDPAQPEAANNFGALVADHRFDDPAYLDRALAAVRRLPRNDEPLVIDTLGWLLFRKGDTAAALPLLERAALLAPALEEVAYHLGAARAAVGDIDGALTSLDKALADGTDAAWADHARALRRDLRALPATSD